MEHEVFVPVTAERLREVLADPVRVARAVPGLQQDAGAEPVTGRLKVRVGGHTITYRGAVRISAREDGSYAVAGDATEARGNGSVKLALTLRVAEAEGGATLRFEGTASADGRVTEFSAEAVGSAVSRLLNRFGGQLGVVAGEGAAAAESGPESGPDADVEAVEEALAPGEFETRVTSDFETTPDADDAAVPEPGRDAAAGEADGADDGAESGSVFDSEVPPPSLDPRAEEDDSEDADEDGEDSPVAEAAHARRTMIGRSAEEVDHAPPRGRYAPVPAPQTVAPNSTLRWAAPAAALVLASAIVVGRMLRRRR
ncbi:SRPBCC domain-containing protein [Streptomyces sp. HUAS 31]|uniref:SRPBCC domain-containing protein n=1 Tax=Streptomyces TaxID=1883 RepID=UPI0023052E7A|nr:SRPBCC domain-containing protein [Streptomyces sp. HUAS 31]WCD98381.1 SRPBCC domain-containing protein [Streptomyces sp. HUAS 31]